MQDLLSALRKRGNTEKYQNTISSRWCGSGQRHSGCEKWNATKPKFVDDRGQKIRSEERK